jgi:hypothetical protein
MSSEIFEEIICITTNGSREHCNCITWVKTNLENEYLVSDVIRLIGLGTHVFFVSDNAGDVVLVKVVPELNPTYIRTKADDTPDDNLLSLPDCPNTYRY